MTYICDMINRKIEESQNPKAIEIKSAATVHLDFYKNLKWWQSISESKNLTLIYGGTDSYTRSDVKTLGWKDCTKSLKD
jgi:hypothetical protein